MKRLTTDQFTFFLLGLLLVMLIELSLFHNGTVFLLFFGIISVYFGINKRRKFLLWTGALFILIALFTLWSLRLYFIVLIGYLIYKQLTKDEVTIEVTNQGWTSSTTKNKLIETMATSTEPYKWEDVLLKRFIGDVVVDTTQTILPEGKSVITIQQAIGKVHIIVPYEVSIRLHYTTVYGEASCLHEPPKRLFNENLKFEDGQIDHKRLLVINVSTWLGDVEVTRA
ncbi:MULTISPECIES: cell wall-active antibiotics response protein LiaF [Bacillales]|uniref:Cell wall-active antibiotics response protein LiaF n=1 Tax=Lysinibacillus louembei TaxID=1470088 RepID=A0ABZ0RX63_9BACI|nr:MULTISPECIES: cell wall-active antibiotics response protein LiaF [Bacillales]MCT6923662.1 cell wall-active antibiotics response protein LiaF [Metasolibacillus sp.]MCT6939615.1 cell wall-active antibiotics response protein LiaF [Metasolibacillus sp.]WPK11842.1 cell wall-active antibiotics response protein LiaF [Lysinibacillus louembei]